MRLDPGLGTGSCQGCVVVPWHKKASQASPALGWKWWPQGWLWPGPGTGRVCPPVQQNNLLPVDFILSIFFLVLQQLIKLREKGECFLC